MREQVKWEYARQEHLENGYPYATTHFVKIGEELIAVGSHGGHMHHGLEQRARLIAAAPDLLAACNAVLDNEMTDDKAVAEFGGYVLDDDVRAQVQEALRKAGALDE